MATGWIGLRSRFSSAVAELGEMQSLWMDDSNPEEMVMMGSSQSVSQ